MKELIVQKDDYGCGAACVAFIVGKSYDETVHLLGKYGAIARGYSLKELVDVLRFYGHSYAYKRADPKSNAPNYVNGTIVYIDVPRDYDQGHYLVKCAEGWFDPWVNLPHNKDILEAKAGIVRHLTSKPLWIAYPRQTG